MNSELDNRLCKTYPQIFAQRTLHPTETLMCWGFECGDGWYRLIDNLCFAIMAHCDITGERPPQCVQVKEKFGTLRFYVDYCESNEVWDLIDQAESLSGKTCEVCGGPGTLRGGGWLKTLCEAHSEGRENFDLKTVP